MPRVVFSWVWAFGLASRRWVIGAALDSARLGPWRRVVDFQPFAFSWVSWKKKNTCPLCSHVMLVSLSGILLYKTFHRASPCAGARPALVLVSICVHVMLSDVVKSCGQAPSAPWSCRSWIRTSSPPRTVRGHASAFCMCVECVSAVVACGRRQFAAGHGVAAVEARDQHPPGAFHVTRTVQRASRVAAVGLNVRSVCRQRARPCHAELTPAVSVRRRSG